MLAILMFLVARLYTVSQKKNTQTLKWYTSKL